MTTRKEEYERFEAMVEMENEEEEKQAEGEHEEEYLEENEDGNI